MTILHAEICQRPASTTSQCVERLNELHHPYLPAHDEILFLQGTCSQPRTARVEVFIQFYVNIYLSLEELKAMDV